MRKLFSATLLAVMLCIGMSAKAQTQAEWEAYLTWYVQTYGVDATQNHVLAITAQMTTQTLLEGQAFSLLELSLGGFSPCLATKIARCEEDFYARLATLTVESTALAVVCLVAPTPIAQAICLAAVVIRHENQRRAAYSTLRTCLRRAREDCPPVPTPIPNHCAILGSETLGDEKEASTREIAPLLPDCTVEFDPCYCTTTPIMVDVSGDGFDLTDAASGVMFNITGRVTEQLAWTKANSDDAFLALDLNGNGLIDNGFELFGNVSAQPDPVAGAERNGFAALAVYDYNADGKIDGSDPVYHALRLWQDRNHNGVSEPEELLSLESVGLKNLFTDYKRSKRVDKHGNEFRYRAKVNDFQNKQLGRWAWDVFLVNSR